MSSYKLYSNISNHDTVLEIWGGSTKHADCIFHYSDFTKCAVCDEDHPMQLTQWLLECASKLSLPFHGIALANWAINNLRDWVIAVDGSSDTWERLMIF